MDSVSEVFNDFRLFHESTKICVAVEKDNVMCWNESHALGLCFKHYCRFKRHGDVNLIKPVKKCKIIYCSETKKISKGYCNKHYKQFRRKAKAIELKDCKVEGCGKKAHALQLCPKHYYRLKKHGDLNYCEKAGFKSGQENYSVINKKQKQTKKCLIKDCIHRDNDRLRIIRGLCTNHYEAWRKYKDMDKVKNLKQIKSRTK